VVRTAMHQLLERAGDWEIIDAENGQEAIAKAQELAPNLIILDLVMPVMDGLAAAREISKLVPQTPLLMHTLHWSPQVELEAQKVGVRKVVPKADSNELVSAIRHFLNIERNNDPQPVVAGATPEVLVSSAPSSVASSPIPSSNIAPPSLATPGITALPRLLDAEKVDDVGSGVTSKKSDMPAEPGDVAAQRAS